MSDGAAKASASQVDEVEPDAATPTLNEARGGHSDEKAVKCQRLIENLSKNAVTMGISLWMKCDRKKSCWNRKLQ